jgi:hypothetical protein
VELTRGNRVESRGSPVFNSTFIAVASERPLSGG